MADPARLLRQILDDTRALVNDLRGAARRLSTRWQWLRLKSKRRMEDAAGQLEQARRTASARTRMCRECRALIPVGARVCPECGASPGGDVSTGFMRLVGNAVPGIQSSTSLVLTLTVLIYALTWVVYLRLSSGGPSNLNYWSAALWGLGANNGRLVLAGQPWRLLTSVFLHGNLLHLGFNCYALITVGPLIEEIYGYRRFLVFYVVTGVAGAAASGWWHLLQYPVPAIGASGAIFGLIGVAAVWGWRRGGFHGGRIKALMVQWAVYGLVMGLVLRADNAAHLGGLAGGALLGLVVSDRNPRTTFGARLWDLLAYACVILVAGSLVMVAVKYQSTLEMIGLG